MTNLLFKVGRIKLETLRFTLVGVGSVSVDAVIYTTLVSLNTCDSETAKKISFLAGAIFGFFFNRDFTFKIKSKRIIQPILFSILYTISFFINYIVHDTVLAFSESSLFGFISATACSTTINFLGQQYYVYKQ